MELLDRIEVPNVDVSVYPVRDHRFVLVLSGEGLDERVTETDPQALGVPPLEGRGSCSPGLKRLSDAVRSFTQQAREILGERSSANMVLLRGFSALPDLPDMGRTYLLNPAAIAAYPMYRGLAHLVGMKVIPTGMAFDDELDTLERHFHEHDFFFLHYKPADAAGEDGDFAGKVEALEYLDARIPRLLELDIDSLVVAGDHSTPAIMGSHSWHPVPLLVKSSIYGGRRGRGVQRTGLRFRVDRADTGCQCHDDYTRERWEALQVWPVRRELPSPSCTMGPVWKPTSKRYALGFSRNRGQLEDERSLL